MIQNFKLRLACVDDVKKIFDLSNDDTVRSNSINSENIEWDKHVKWFKERIKKEYEPFYIVEDENNNFMGQIRIDCKNNENILSISIVKEYRGKRLASKIIKQSIIKSGFKNITAYIYDNNIISIKSFKKAGFEESICDEMVDKNNSSKKFVKYIYKTV